MKMTRSIDPISDDEDYINIANPDDKVTKLINKFIKYFLINRFLLE